MEENAKRQPKLSQLHMINLESDTDQSESEETVDTTLTPGQDSSDLTPAPEGGPSADGDKNAKEDPITLATVNEKVDRLLKNFDVFDKKLEKNATKCRRKFMNIQSAHNSVIERINTLSGQAETAATFNEDTRSMGMPPETGDTCS